MPRPRKKPDYNADKIMQDLLAVVVESYEETGELKQTAEELELSPLKVRKLLITAGIYSTEISDEVNELREQGKTLEQIQEITGLRKSSINGYLPYTKAIYNPEEVSLNAERIRMYRQRKSTVRRLQEEQTEDALWDAVVAFQKYPFYTISGLPFSYVLKIGKDGSYNKELLIDRRKESKTLAWSSVLLAFHHALEMKGAVVRRPKELGDIRGISYIYPMLYRFGMIEIENKTE